ncbi:hypothetical protein GMOD_00009149 [Pyrenophora seminiperda CCB06]|uniref:Uncharacterized protein n=1 Tax=Pyrenophora seminiperda CCB06 TaxID=1302712 RepID=A0A3M7MBH4_9PLEO|nr:hypothetical protein GMOD_00009149 [Pyrenophora seminiperda CCB06]
MRVPHSGWINVETVVEDIEDHFSGRYGISRRQIERTLHLLFETFAPSHAPLRGATRINLVQQLLAHMQSEAHNALWAPARDLRFVRHAFIILTYLALHFDSDLLAKALRAFWCQAEPIVCQCEQPHHGEEWYMAAAKLDQLGGPSPNPYHTAWPRSRAPRTLEMPWPSRPHRARSAPAVRHGHHHSDMLLHVPAFTNSAWASPILSPVTYPRVDYMDDVDTLQYQQQEMSWKLDKVDKKLDVLMTAFF